MLACLAAGRKDNFTVHSSDDGDEVSFCSVISVLRLVKRSFLRLSRYTSTTVTVAALRLIFIQSQKHFWWILLFAVCSHLQTWKKRRWQRSSLTTAAACARLDLPATMLSPRFSLRLSWKQARSHTGHYQPRSFVMRPLQTLHYHHDSMNHNFITGERRKFLDFTMRLSHVVLPVCLGIRCGSG